MRSIFVHSCLLEPHYRPVLIRHATRVLLNAVAFTVLAACHASTEPEADALTASAERVPLPTEAERSAWPFTPTVSGGSAVVVRGFVDASCSPLRAEASRSGQSVTVSIAPQEPNAVCPAIWASWQPFRATVTGLEPGTYQVQALVAGHKGRAEFAATILQP